MCRYYETFWQDTLRLSPRAVKFPNRQRSRFPRLEAWQRKQPPVGSRRRCQCGAPDKWRCWIATQEQRADGSGATVNDFDLDVYEAFASFVLGVLIGGLIAVWLLTLWLA